MSSAADPATAECEELIGYHQDGRAKRTTRTFYRGPDANFNPTDESLTRDNALYEYVLKGWAPPHSLISPDTPVVAFGSCFAANISNYLFDRGYCILNKTSSKTYVSTMGDGIVNTFAIRQQFEWAWLGRQPTTELWHGYDARAFGYDDDVRVATRALFDAADVFIITLGLAEVWYDEPTAEVFWRAVPMGKFDPARHKFRVTTVEENRANLLAIYRLIKTHRPAAAMIVTVSPIPLTATFRPVSCVTANAVSKGILRVAVDEFARGLPAGERGAYYFPSYEIVTSLFQNAFMEDRKHPHHHVLDFNMKAFEHFFCTQGIDAAQLASAFGDSRALDRRVGSDGHFSVPRTMNPKAGGAAPPFQQPVAPDGG
jgi:GSCFA family